MPFGGDFISLLIRIEQHCMPFRNHLTSFIEPSRDGAQFGRYKALKQLSRILYPAHSLSRVQYA